MKKIILYVVCMTAFLHTVLGQMPVFTRVHNGNSGFYHNLDTAIFYSQTGDTLYIPGGVFPTLTVNKGIHIYGTGYHPDSTLATYATSFSSVYILAGADSGSIQGILCDNMYIGNNGSNSNVSNYQIKRCHITGSLDFCHSCSTSPASLFSLSEIIVTGIFFRNAMNVAVRKSIIGYFYEAYYASFENNIFLTTPLTASSLCWYAEFFGTGSYCIFQNNIIDFVNCSTISFSLFNNNIYKNSISNGTFGTNAGNGNIQVANFDSVLVSPAMVNFDFNQNYHLLPNSVGIGAGTDGTDIGLYGTSAPFKDGGLPDNPHIALKNIGFQTGPNGTLHVQVKVTGQ